MTQDKESGAFRKAIEKIPDISSGYCKGLQAMGSNSKYVKAEDSRCLSGSVDIDNCTKRLYPNDSRWDYVIGYDEKAYFVEVHPADAGNVDEMIKKAEWLKRWLNQYSSELVKIEAMYWVPFGRTNIPKTSKQYRLIAKNNLIIMKSLKLPIR